MRRSACSKQPFTHWTAKSQVASYGNHCGFHPLRNRAQLYGTRILPQITQIRNPCGGEAQVALKSFWVRLRGKSIAVARTTRLRTLRTPAAVALVLGVGQASSHKVWCERAAGHTNTKGSLVQLQHPPSIHREHSIANFFCYLYDLLLKSEIVTLTLTFEGGNAYAWRFG